MILICYHYDSIFKKEYKNGKNGGKISKQNEWLFDAFHFPSFNCFGDLSVRRNDPESKSSNLMVLYSPDDFNHNSHQRVYNSSAE